jgi:hypothetical protein
MRPGREPDTSSVKYGDAVSTPQPRVKLAHIIKLLRITYPCKTWKKALIFSAEIVLSAGLNLDMSSSSLMILMLGSSAS